MTDIVAVSLITAGSSLLGATIGAVTTYKVSARNADSTVAAAKSQNRIELAKVEAENSRLQAQHAEEERRNRQSTYHRAVAALQRIYGLEANSDDLQQVAAEWRHCLAGVQIFGSEAASLAVESVQKVVVNFPADGTDRDKWQGELIAAMSQFIASVREDIGTPGKPTSINPAAGGPPDGGSP